MLDSDLETRRGCPVDQRGRPGQGSSRWPWGVDFRHETGQLSVTMTHVLPNKDSNVCRTNVGQPHKGFNTTISLCKYFLICDSLIAKNALWKESLVIWDEIVEFD